MLPHRLKAARLKAGLSQERLGILAGIDEATASARMNQYERGIHTPDFELTCRLASVMEIPACYFYAVEDDLAGVLEILCHSSNIQSKRNDTCPSPSISTKHLKLSSPVRH